MADHHDHLYPIDQIPKIKIFPMFVSEHPEVVEGRRRLIATDVPDSEEASEDGSIDNYGADLDEEDESGFGRGGCKNRSHSIGNRRGGIGASGL